MSHKQPLKRRIIIAFFLMTFVVAGVFSISIFIIVQVLEQHFMSQEMNDDLQAVLRHDMAYTDIIKLNKDTQFYTTNKQVNYPIPKLFKGAKQGFSEVLLQNGISYYVYKKLVNDEEYLIVKDQTVFEERERILFTVVLLCFIVALITSWLLGKLLAQRILAPVIKLVSQVDSIKIQQDEIKHIPLSSQYTDDEVGLLATAFDRAFGELHASLERERLFTSDVSHELRTPLMVIASSCELLLEDKQIPSVLYRQIDRISRANKDMYELVQTFLMLARLQSDLVLMEGKTLLTVAEEQAKQWQEKFIDKGLTFSFDVRSDDSKEYNAILLRTVISNLLRNALHYTEKGGVTLIIEQNGFYVEDTGVGIPEDQHQLIFQAFVRGSKTRGEGLGLGLSLVKRICAHQGWQVEVFSKASGSVFHIILNR